MGVNYFGQYSDGGGVALVKGGLAPGLEEVDQLTQMLLSAYFSHVLKERGMTGWGDLQGNMPTRIL